MYPTQLCPPQPHPFDTSIHIYIILFYNKSSFEPLLNLAYHFDPLFWMVFPHVLSAMGLGKSRVEYRDGWV